MVAVADIASVAYAQDASKISKGTLSTERLSLGDTSGTVAAGDDARFDTIAVGEPDVNISDSRAAIWGE